MLLKLLIIGCTTSKVIIQLAFFVKFKLLNLVLQELKAFAASSTIKVLI